MKAREALVALLIFGVLAIALAPEAALGQGTFGYHDLRHHHLPWRAWAAARWAAGEVPWWASGAANGFPLLAEGEGGFLYPPTMLLFIALPAGLALSASVLGHHVWAALGMWAFVRHQGLRGPAPILAGVVYAFNGFLVSHTLYLGMQNGLAWLPWALFAMASERRTLLALSVAMMALAGHPQAAAFSGLLLAGWALVHQRRGALVRTVAAGAAGLAVASPQLLASLELSRFSMREGGVGIDFANIGAMPIQELVGFVLPYAFGFDRPADVAETYYHRGTGYWGAGVNSWEMCVYVGVPVLTLALLGGRRSRFFAVVLGVSTLLMLGGPLWALVRAVPGFDYFRFPARFALLAMVALSVLAAHGLDRMRRVPRRAPAQRRLAVVAVLATMSFGVAYLGLHTRLGEVVGVLTAHFERQTELPPPPPPMSVLATAVLPPPEVENAAEIPLKVARIVADLRRSTALNSPRAWIPLALLCLTGLLLRRPRLLTLLVAADLLAFGRDYHPTVPLSEVLRPPDWLAPTMTTPGGWRTSVLDRRVPVSFDADLLPSSLGLPLGTQDVLIPSPLLLLRNDALLAAAGLDVGDKGAVKVQRYLAHQDVARRLGVRFIATLHEVPGLVPKVRGRYYLYEDPGALPRARVVPCTRSVASAEAAYTAVLDEAPARTVVVEGGTTACADGDGRADADGRAKVELYTDTTVEITATGPGTLVLMDTHYPGWTAKLDGLPAPILQADLLGRAVALPKGEHTVSFHYTPTAGPLIWLWGLGGGLMLGGLALGASRNRKLAGR